MIDNRCPKCNRPVQGKEEMLSGCSKQPASTCQHCKTTLVLLVSRSDVGVTYYYDVKK